MRGGSTAKLMSLFVVALVLSFSRVQGLSFTLTPLDSVAVEGQLFWWHCSATGAVSYSWRFNDAYIPNSVDYQTLQNGSLLIARVRQSDIGGYQCVANDGFSSIYSRTAVLALAYLSTSFKIQPRTEYKTTGESVTFICEIESHPPPTITWLHNGQKIENRTIDMVTQEMSVLSLNDIKFEDEGQYMCEGKNPLMDQITYSNSANLVLRGKPELKVEPVPVAVAVGQSTVFHCLAVGEPSPDVTWYDSRDVRGELPIPTVVDMKYFVYPNGTLLIQNVQKNDAGFYTCKARNPLGETSKMVLLTVTDESTRPMFTLVPNNTIVFEGETVQWVCAASGTPEPVITWSRLGAILPVDRVQFPYRGSLQIINAQRDDSGSYICQATSAGMTIRHQVELRVFVGPQFTQTPSNVAVTLGAQASLPCSAEAVPIPAIFWSTPTGETVVSPTLTSMSGITVFGNGTLYIAQVEERHAGSYTCVAGNEVSTVTASAAISVEYAPVFVTSPQNVDAQENSSPVLQCEGSGNPVPTVRWYYGDNPMPLQTGFSYALLANGSLQVNTVQKRQEGSYRCELSNMLGRIQSSALLTVMVPPSFLHDPQEVVTQAGGSATLDCLVSGSPSPITRWQRAGSVLVLESNMVLFPNNSLYITDLQPHQFGEYACFASNRAGSKTLKSFIHTPELPEFLIPPSNKTGNVSDKVVIPCMAKSQQQVFYYWYLSDMIGTPLARLNYGLVTDGRGSSAYVEDDGTLVFQSVREIDQGWFLCMAANEFGSATGIAYLTVLVPPTLIASDLPQTVTDGQSAMLHCKFWANPEPQISWQLPRQGFKFSTNSTMYTITNDGLSITAVDPKIHWGTWVCEACNLLGCSQGQVELQIAGTPILTGVESYKNPVTGEIILKCLAVATSIPTVNYFMDGVRIDPLTPPPGHFINADGSLRISSVSLSGSYACSASNNMGSTQEVYQLRIPGIPVGVTATALNSNSVEVNWSDIQNGELPATGHVVQYMPSQSTGTSWITVNNSVVETKYTIPGLSPFKEYDVRVGAFNVLGASAFSDAVMVLTREGAPGPPENVWVNLRGNIIYITWDRTPQPNGLYANLMYEVGYKDLNSSAPYVTTLHGSGSPYETTLPLITYGNTLDVNVRTINPSIGLASDSISVQFVLAEEAPRYFPVVTKVTAQGNSAAFVEWTYPANQTVSGFVVDYTRFMEEFDPSKRHRILAPKASSFNVTGLDVGTTYHIRVAAFTRGGFGPFSQQVDVKTDYGAVGPGGPEKESDGPSIGAILGIIAAVIIILFLIAMLLVVCCYRRKKQAELIQMDIDRIYEEKKKPVYSNKAYESDTLTSRKSGIRGSYDLVAASHGNPGRSGEAAFTISGNAITHGPPSASSDRQSSYNPGKKTAQPDVVLISQSRPTRSTHSSPRAVRTVAAPDTPTSVHSSRRGTEADFEINEMEYDEEIYVTGHHRSRSPNPSAVYVVQGDTSPLFPPEKPPRLYAKKGETPDGLIFVDPETRYNTVPKMGTSPVRSEIQRSERRKRRDISPNGDYTSSSKRYGNSYNSLPRTNPRQSSQGQMRNKNYGREYSASPASLSTAHAVVTLPRKHAAKHQTNTIPRDSRQTLYISGNQGNRTPVPPQRTSSYENGSMRPDYGSLSRPRSSASGVSKLSVPGNSHADIHYSTSTGAENGFWRPGYDNSASLF